MVIKRGKKEEMISDKLEISWSYNNVQQDVTVGGVRILVGRGMEQRVMLRPTTQTGEYRKHAYTFVSL